MTGSQGPPRSDRHPGPGRNGRSTEPVAAGHGVGVPRGLHVRLRQGRYSVCRGESALRDRGLRAAEPVHPSRERRFHRSPSGTNQYNAGPSQRRIATVRDALIRAGVSADRIETGTFAMQRAGCSNASSGARSAMASAKFWFAPPANGIDPCQPPLSHLPASVGRTPASDGYCDPNASVAPSVIDAACEDGVERT